MEISWGRALWRNYLGQSPDWYKLALIIFLIVNPLIFLISPFVAGWLLVAEFIFTLAMALKCYPLLPGGLLAIEAVFIGMTSAEHVREEVAANLEVLLLMTMVGEPQNLIIAKAAGWHFGDFFLRMSPVTVPVLICGLLTCLLVEKLRWFGYGETLPEKVREVLQQFDDQSRHQRTRQDKIRLIVQAIIGVWLVTALALHLAEVGLIGLSVIILATSLTGVTDEHAIGKAFTESLPFTALLTVFFSVVAVIIDQQLFSPIIQFVLQASEHAQLSLFYIFNGLLSSISDNVFVGTIYINEAKAAMESGAITLKQYELLAVAINTGTNLPSVATPNGQAAFLFLLTSALAPLIRLSYGRMVWMALPYTLVLTLVGLLCVEFTLAPVTEWFMQMGWIATL